MKNTDSDRDKPEYKHFPLIYVIVFHTIIIGITIWLIKPPFIFRNTNSANSVPAVSNFTHLKIIRDTDYQFIKPLRLVDIDKESTSLKPLKDKVNLIINEKEKAGLISVASVYLKELDNGRWMSINGDEKFRAGSINKISILIYYLKRAELEPGILTRELVFTKKMGVLTHETFTDRTIEPGKKYTIRELLTRMIQYSDNVATNILIRNFENAQAYQKIFTDLGLSKPDQSDNNYSLNAQDISRFLRVLYNSTYLTPEYSEWALEILSKSTFKEGIIKQLPNNLKVAHKFGESGDNDQPQLSETGIIYYDDNTYLLTIMTKGTNVQQEAEAISDISKNIYEGMTH